MIRWITDRLGTAPAIELTNKDDVAVIDVRQLVDKHGNPPQVVNEKIEQGVALLRQQKRVVVCCDYGISRSNAIAAGILSRFEDISLDTAISVVIQTTGEREIKLDPLRAVRAALNENTSTSDCNLSPRVLLTGASGFLGNFLSSKLSNKFYTISPSSSEVDITKGALELDILVKKHRINCMVHLANPRVYTSNRALGDSLTMMCNVLEVCRENCLHLIYPSSLDVYAGYRSNSLVISKDLPAFPNSPNGETKFLCEQLVYNHTRLYHLQCAIIRSSPIIGGNGIRPKFIFNFINKALKNEVLTTHKYLNGEPMMDCLWINDYASLVELCILNKFSGHLNVGCGQLYTTKQIAEIIKVVCNSVSQLEAIQLNEYTTNYLIDNTQSFRQLGWKPTIKLEDSLRLVIKDISIKTKGDLCA